MNNPFPARHIRRRTALASSLLAAWPFAQAQGTAAKPDAAKFFAPAQMTGAALSPNGKRLLMRLRGVHGRSILSVLELDTLKSTVVCSSDLADAQDFVWVNNNRVAFTLGDWETPAGKQDSAPGLFAVNADGTGYKQLAERQSNNVRYGGDEREMAPWNTFLLDGSTQRDGDEVLVEQPQKMSDNEIDYIKLLSLNTLTGRSKEIDGPLHAVGWVADAKGQLRAAVVRDGNKGAVMWKDPATNVWRKLREYDAVTGDSDLHIRHIGPDGKMYVTARRGHDLRALWVMDPATGNWSEAPLVSSPHFDVDAAVVATQDKVLGYRFDIDAEVTQWIDAGMKTLQAQIDKVLPNTANRLSVPWRGDSPWVLIEAASDVQPTQYFLFNRETKKFTRLGGQRPDIDAKQMAPMQLVRIKARDGLEIPTWVTMPPDAPKGKNLPMVVLVHGGPFVPAPTWHFDAEVQFLAARGYVVLQPQFRGTDGFGLKHHLAGWRQWGKAMQADLTDTTRWAIAQGIADPKRIAISGASYGGYATLMGLVQEPGLYRCGVAWVAVTDLDMLYSVKWSDMSNTFRQYGLPKTLGDRVKDADDLKAHSPLTHAASIKQPLLLAYGSADRRVPLIHGEKFKKAVQPVNPQLEWVEYEDEGHGWALPANRVDFFNRMARFLDKHTAPAG